VGYALERAAPSICAMKSNGGNESASNARRRFLGVLAGGAAAVPAATLAEPLGAVNPATVDSPQPSGYRVTPHVKAFYKSALGPR